MKILIISGNYPPKICGIGDYTHRLAQVFKKKGHTIDVLSSGDSQFSIKSWGRKDLFLALRYIPWESYDVISLQYEGYSFQQSYQLPLFLAAKNIKFYTTFHEVFAKNIFQDMKNRWLFKNSKAVIVNDTRSLKRLDGYGSTPIFKIGVGSNLTPIDPPQKLPRFTFGYFGFLNKVKRTDLLIEALQIVREKIDAKLRLIGDFNKQSSDWKDIENLIESKNLKSHVEIFSQATERNAARWIQECDVMVLPFSDGASPRRGSLQACLALGKATITTPPEVFDPDFDLNSFSLLPELSSQKLAEKLCELQKNISLRNTLESNALQISQKFTWDQIANKYLNIFQQT